MSESDRPSAPDPLVTPPDGVARAGLVYVDDSATARHALRRALYPHGVLLETFPSLAALRDRPASPLRGALLDVDLGQGFTGLDAARMLREWHPGLPVAFYTASGPGPHVAAFAALGPVFIKHGDLTPAITWLVNLLSMPALSAVHGRR